MAVDPNGRIVVAGTVSGFDSSDNFFQDFAVARYNANGRLDASFGTGGEVLTSFGADISATAAGVAIQPDGKIVVAGSITDPDTFNNDFALARLQRQRQSGHLLRQRRRGRPPASGPTRRTPPWASSSSPTARSWSAGRSRISTPASSTEFGLAHYNANGTLDAAFGTGGEVTTSFGPDASAFAAGLAIQPNGKIVVAGTVQDFGTTSSRSSGWRTTTPTAALDTTFGSGGEVTTSFGPNTSASAAGVAIAPDGEIIVAGTITDNFESNFTLAGYVGEKSHRWR